MGSQARKISVYDEFLNVPDHIHAEIIAGELITSPRPGGRHTRASSSIEIRIGGPFDHGIGGPGGWWIVMEPEVHLSGDVIIPDVAGWKKEVMPVYPTAKSYVERAPQWVCEVLSPGTERYDRMKKMPIYAREKVDHVWLVNPMEKTLEVYARNNHTWLLLNVLGGSEIVRAEPFETIDFDLGSLWLPD